MTTMIELKPTIIDVSKERILNAINGGKNIHEARIDRDTRRNDRGTNRGPSEIIGKIAEEALCQHYGFYGTSDLSKQSPDYAIYKKPCHEYDLYTKDGKGLCVKSCSYALAKKYRTPNGPLSTGVSWLIERGVFQAKNDPDDPRSNHPICPRDFSYEDDTSVISCLVHWSPRLLMARCYVYGYFPFVLLGDDFFDRKGYHDTDEKGDRQFLSKTHSVNLRKKKFAFWLKDISEHMRPVSKLL
jgi:hypothetical protein